MESAEVLPPSIHQPKLGSLIGRSPLGSHEGEGLLLAERVPGGRQGVGLPWPDPPGGPPACSASPTPRTAPGLRNSLLLLQGTPCPGGAQPHGPQQAKSTEAGPGVLPTEGGLVSA